MFHRFDKQSRLLALAALLAFGTDIACAAEIKYPDIATVASPRVLGEFNGVKVYGGGFGSALAPDPRARGYFYLLTDRGPNTDSNDADKKVFPMPRFTPQIGRFKLQGDKLVLVKTIEIKNAKSKKITGLPNPNYGNTGEVAVDMARHRCVRRHRRRGHAARRGIVDLLVSGVVEGGSDGGAG